MTRREFPYGDGKAVPRIAAIIEQWLGRKRNCSIETRAAS